MMKYLLLLMLVLVTCWASNPIFENVAPEVLEEVQDTYRLPDDVIPTNYKIELTPYLDTKDAKNFTFEGHSQISLKLKNNNTKTKTITFHAKELEFSNITLKYINVSAGIKQETKTNIPKQINKEKDFVTLFLDDELNSNMTILRLYIDFTGKLNDKLRGFYRSSYQEGTETRWLATTHFEPVAARQAFPCWDEPALKATFNITINSVPPKYNAISNMLEGEKYENGTVVFPETQKMSTYLVAFVVSDYDKKTNKQKNFRVWTKPNAINNTNFALEIGEQTLKELSDFTGFNYYKENVTGIKMDQISIPDFSAGAMENWGLVTYRESALLYDPIKSTTQDKQSIATVIAHEFSHQWFGNLVTCDWWDYIWLNEGFATFFQYYTTDWVVQTLYKESWRLMEQFAIKNVQASAFVVDAAHKTRPLNSNINAKTPAQISSLFDDIAYKKGASILLMMRQFLTDDIFKTGLHRYLKTYQYKTAKPYELLNAIEDTKNEDEIKALKKILPNNVSLNDVMDNWLNKSGYPVVTVIRLSDKVNLTQKRFFLEKPAKQDKTQWYIPITYVTEEEPNNIKSLWMEPEEALIIDKLKDKKWILFNKDQKGYYRVNYDEANWKLLVEYLQSENYKTISPINRAQLIDDALNLARGGYLTYNNALQITKYLLQEIDYIPWYAAVRAFNYLDGVLEGSTIHSKYRAYVVQRIQNFVKAVNYTNPEGTHVEKLSKILALNAACKYGLKDCEDFAKEQLKDWLDSGDENKKQLSPDLKKGIICAGLRKEDITTWKKAEQKYRNSKDKDEQAEILAGLGCTTSDDITNTFLNLSIGENPITDIFSVMNSIATGNAQSFDILLNFINTHSEEIQKADKDNTQLSALLNKLASKVISDKQYAKLSLTARQYLQETEKFTGLDYALENLAWINAYQKETEQWMEENFQQDDSSASSFTLATFLVIIPILLIGFN
ncbi:aminopeptidase N [Anoplolepis gracilipes]|uniref:aminopeptidase N n=1 Tax=Anoplolepis gracilipes TaxID=354296 RepID=UPI003BA246EB